MSTTPYFRTLAGIGNLGVGTTSPTSNLQVVGNAYVSNALLTTNVLATTINATTINVSSLSSPLPVSSGGTGTSTAIQNVVFAGPASGGSGAPAFRALVSADIPNNAANTSGTAAGISGSQTANYVYAAPNGSAGTASFRALASGDIPNNAANTSGTSAGISGSQTANYVYAAPNGSAGTASFRALVSGDIPNPLSVTLIGTHYGTVAGSNTVSASNVLVASGLPSSIVQGSNVAVFSNAAGTGTVVINSSGQVGIGTAAVQPVPAGAGSNTPVLFVYGTTPSRGALIQTTGGSAGTANVCINTDGTNPNIELRSSTNSGAPYIDFASSSSGVDYDARMILVNNGNTFSLSSNIIQFTPTTGVGIGIASPLAPFHVFSNVGASFSNTTSVNYQQTSVIGFNYGGGVGAGTRDSFRIISSVVNRDNGAGPYYDYGAQADLVFQRKTNNLYSGGATDQTYTEVMRLGGATGYVGIGTTSPTTALQVNGGQISVPSYISSVGSPYTTGQQFYFAFNGNLTDSQSGVATTPVGNAGGFVDGAAIRFNGNYYFTFPNSLVTSVVSMTVAFWFCPLSTSGLQTIFSFANGSNSINMNIDGNGSGGLQAYIATPNQWTVSGLNTGALNLGTWYHVAYTCSTTAATCYVNGVQVSQQTGTYTNGSFGMGTVYVGTNGDGQGRRANCFLDELRVYNTVLTGAQVATLYSSVTFTPNGMSGGSVLTNCVGVGVTTPVNSIDTSGAVAIGSYAGANQAPAGGLICPGNVGIGLTSPSYPLHVVSAGTAINLSNTTAQSTLNAQIGRINFGNGGSDASIAACVNYGGTNNNTDLRFYTSLDFGNQNLERMRIDRSGNVGINQTSPGYALDVTNDVNCSGSFRVGGVLQPKIPSSLQGSWSSVSSVTINGFDLATAFYSAEIRLNWYKNGSAGNNGNVSFSFKDTGGNSLTVQEANTTEYRNGGATNNTGAVAYLASGAEPVAAEYGSVIRIWSVRPGGTGGRYHFTFESVGCYANIGATTNRGQGFVTVFTGTVSQIVVSCSSGTFGGVYSVVQYI